MTLWLSSELSAALEQDVLCDCQGINFDSRQIKQGDIFIALNLVNDGHQHVQHALDNGAVAAIVSRQDVHSKFNQSILVQDTFVAMQKLAMYRRAQTNHAKYIAVTGSSGKTSTKEMLARLLPNSFATIGNFNSKIGTPLCLANIPKEIKYVVMEVGMSQKGNIHNLCKMIRPNISIITNIMPAHIGNFDSLYEIALAKSEIFDFPGQDFCGIIPFDCEYRELFEQKLKDLGVRMIYGFGENHDAHSRLLSHEIVNAELAKVTIDVLSHKVVCDFGIAAKHQAVNLAAAMLVAKLLNVDIDKSDLATLKNYWGRGNLIKSQYKNISIIHDAYNSNPGSLAASLEYFAHIQHQNKVLVLADMLELGENSNKYHAEIVLPKARLIALLGSNMRHLYDAIQDRTNVVHFYSLEELEVFLLEALQSDDLVLFKGSNGTRLWSVIDKIVGII